MISKEQIEIYEILRDKKEIPKGYDDEVVMLYYAYHGDIKKYSKLRKGRYLQPLKGCTESHPAIVARREELCIMRGVYFHLDFAYWVLKNIPLTKKLEKAISSKLIMNNDLSFVKDNVYCIWYPEIPSKKTCERLFAMNIVSPYVIGRVCVIANYNDLYKELNLLPEITILEEAIRGGNREIIELVKNRPSDEIVYKLIDSKSKIVDLNYKKYKKIGDFKYSIPKYDVADDFTTTQIGSSIYDPLEELKTRNYVHRICSIDKIKNSYSPSSDDWMESFDNFSTDDFTEAIYDYDPLGTEVITDSDIRSKLKVIEKLIF